MSWKTDLHLADLPPEARIEARCRRCAMSRYYLQAELAARPALAQAYLDEVEQALRCANRFCRAPVRIALVHDDLTEGFVGGMA